MLATELSTRSKVLVLAGTMLGLLVAAVNQTVVSTALPRIVGELGGVGMFSWIITSFMLTSTAVVPLVGKLSDVYGRKPLFMLGIGLFMVTSAIAGLSQNIVQLIVFRALQGLGAGTLMANAFAAIGDVFPPAERGKYQGLFSAVFGLASVVGPAVGGALTDHLSWRWVFYVNIPFGLLALAVLGWGFPGLPQRPARPQVDYLGVASMMLAVVPLLLALVWGGDQYPWLSGQVLGLLALAGAGLILFLLAEARAADPLLPLGLFRNRVFVVANSVTFLTGIAMFGAISFIPLFVQGALGASATHSGLVTMPMMLGMVTSSTIAGQMVSRLGRYRALVLVGASLMTLAMYLLSLMDAGTDQATAVRNMVVLGVGLGMSMPVLGLVVQNALPYRLLGVASASSQFFRQVGGLLGVAVFGTLMNSQLRTNLAQSLPETVSGRVPSELLAPLQDARVLLQPEVLAGLEGRFLAALGEEGPALFAQALAALREALADALAPLFFIGFVLSAAGVAIALWLPELPLRRRLGEEAPPAHLPPQGLPRSEGRLPYSPPAAAGDDG